MCINWRNVQRVLIDILFAYVYIQSYLHPVVYDTHCLWIPIEYVVTWLPILRCRWADRWLADGIPLNRFCNLRRDITARGGHKWNMKHSNEVYILFSSCHMNISFLSLKFKCSKSVSENIIPWLVSADVTGYLHKTQPNPTPVHLKAQLGTLLTMWHRSSGSPSMKLGKL